MNKPKLTYFDAPVSRGEECRLALHLAGIEFQDARVKPADWPAMKEQMPYGGLPVLELPGQPPLAQSNAILVLIGRCHGLHPADDFDAARHESMMQHVEDLRAVVEPTIGMGAAEKRVAREMLVAGFLPAWALCGEEHPRSAFLRWRAASRRGPETSHGGALVYQRQGRLHSSHDIRRLSETHRGVRGGP
jgi:glutathione S-transferase